MYIKEYQIKYRKTHKKQSKNYRIKHKNRIKLLQHKWYLKNKQLVIARVNKRRNNKRYMYLKWSKKYQKEHRKEIQTRYKIWYKLNKQKLNQYYRNKKLNNANFKILCNLRNRIWYALKGNPKISTTMKLVGCSIEELKHHLESQFKPGMSWNNYGRKGWVVDHIKPCATFNLSKPREQRKCFNYKNLQPLWYEENLKKGRKNV